jgi:hypothetical protein
LTRFFSGERKMKLLRFAVQLLCRRLWAAALKKLVSRAIANSGTLPPGHLLAFTVYNRTPAVLFLRIFEGFNSLTGNLLLTHPLGPNGLTELVLKQTPIVSTTINTFWEVSTSETAFAAPAAAPTVHFWGDYP